MICIPLRSLWIQLSTPVMDFLDNSENWHCKLFHWNNCVCYSFYLLQHLKHTLKYLRKLYWREHCDVIIFIRVLCALKRILDTSIDQKHELCSSSHFTLKNVNSSHENLKGLSVLETMYIYNQLSVSLYSQFIFLFLIFLVLHLNTAHLPVNNLPSVGC